MNLWQTIAVLTAMFSLSAAALAIWIWIDYRQAKRRLTKMRQQTDEKRQAALAAGGQNGSSRML